MRIALGMVTEVTKSFLNQTKLSLFSFRRNAGELSSIPVHLVTNNVELPEEERKFFVQHFAPISFSVLPKLEGPPCVSKLNVLFAPVTYDVLLYMDCDTVVVDKLDGILDSLAYGNEFVCRRGGLTDRGAFSNIERTLLDIRPADPSVSRVKYNGHEEWPMFNTGVYVITRQTVLKMRVDAIALTRFLLSDRKHLVTEWMAEQCAMSLACIKNGVRVGYLDEVYNSWGNLWNVKIVHCFKSAYKFNRYTMLDGNKWEEDYAESGLTGKILVAKAVRDYRAHMRKGGWLTRLVCKYLRKH